MKLTPTVLFLLLLLILVLSIVFSRFLPLSHNTEGFIAFQKDKETFDYVFIPQYSKTSTSVAKLYDNLFFDTANGNVIEVNGQAYIDPDTAGNVQGNTQGNIRGSDTNGKTITSIYVTKRDGTYNSSPYTTSFASAYTSSGGITIQERVIEARDTPESLISTMTSAYMPFVYTTKTTNTDSYQLFYLPWGSTTFLHLIKLGSEPQHLSTYMFDISNIAEIYKYTASNNITVGATASGDTDASNNNFITDSTYNSNNQLYQISKTVRFDKVNANLVIKNVDGSLTVYNRYGRIINDYVSNYRSSIPNTDFNPWIVSDGANRMVLYISIAQRTMISIISLNPSNQGQFTLGNVVRFDKRGLVSTTDQSRTTTTTIGGNAPSESTAVGSDYYKWLAYWNSQGNTKDYPMDEGGDYILKTQVVPPVCPQCPSCTGGGVCTNCGGQGGSGTQGQSGYSITNADAIKSGQGILAVNEKNVAVGGSTTYSDGKFATGANANTLGGAAAVTGLGVVAGAEGVVKTGANVLTTTAQGITNLAGKTVDTAGNLIGGAGQGAYNLVSGAGQGAYNLVSGAGQGIASLGRPTNINQQSGYGPGSVPLYNGAGGYQQVQPGQAQAQGQYGGVPAAPGIDQYSYYGALPSRSSNFLPLTTSFSAFSK